MYRNLFNDQVIICVAEDAEPQTHSWWLAGQVQDNNGPGTHAREDFGIACCFPLNT